jgi:hypothetical protein
MCLTNNEAALIHHHPDYMRATIIYIINIRTSRQRTGTAFTSAPLSNSNWTKAAFPSTPTAFSWTKATLPSTQTAFSNRVFCCSKQNERALGNDNIRWSTQYRSVGDHVHISTSTDQLFAIEIEFLLHAMNSGGIPSWKRVIIPLMNDTPIAD